MVCACETAQKLHFSRTQCSRLFGSVALSLCARIDRCIGRRHGRHDKSLRRRNGSPTELRPLSGVSPGGSGWGDADDAFLASSDGSRSINRPATPPTPLGGNRATFLSTTGSGGEGGNGTHGGSAVELRVKETLSKSGAHESE